MSDFETSSEAPKELNPTEAREAEVSKAATEQSRGRTFSRYTMFAPLIKGDQARPDVESLLLFSTFRDNPRITVHTKDPEDQNNNYGKIVAAMDIVTWNVLADYVLALSDEAVARNGKEALPIKNYNLYKGGEKFDKEQHINTTVVGRDDAGRIYIKVIEEGRPTPVFFFGPPKFHHLINADKTPVDAGRASRLYARAFVKSLSNVFDAAMAASKQEESAKGGKIDVKTPGGQNGGGGWKSNNGGGNWQNRNGGGNGWKGNNGGGGGWKGNNGGGWKNNNGGGNGWKGNNGGGNWQNRNGGNGGGNWQSRNNGGGGGYNQNQAASGVSDTDIPF